MTNPPATLPTLRLIGEAITSSHFAKIHHFHIDPLVMKTLSADGRPLFEETTSKHIQQTVEHW